MKMAFFAYAAGHGCADVHQYFMLNEADINKVCFKLEEELMLLSKQGGGNNSVFAVYDICR